MASRMLPRSRCIVRSFTEFDVSPADGSIIYLVQQAGIADEPTQSLIRINADGTSSTVLLEGSNATAPRFSPDGTQIAFGVGLVMDAGAPAQSLRGGVYVIPASGGTPGLVQASDSATEGSPGS